jgi:hypothetical protein
MIRLIDVDYTLHVIVYVSLVLMYYSVYTYNAFIRRKLCTRH